MKKHLFYFSVVVMSLLFVSCGGGKKGGKSVLTPTSSGRAYEILVVIDQDMWERPAGRALYNVLDTDVPGLPQSERSFRMMYTDPTHYDATLKLVRNIIVADVQNIYTQPKMKYGKDVYAYPQAILTIQAPDEESFGEYVTQNKQTIIDFFTHAEMNRQITVLETKHNNYVYNEVKKMFGCEVWVPGELTAHKSGENFFWAGTNTATGDQNFVIYSFPYRDKNTFTKEYFLQKRDSVMKENIPGAREGMYMATDTLMTDVRPITVQDAYALEARGLWRIKGDFMGGPFVSHMRLDEKNQRIIVSEIFIYSPDKLKRNLVRRMEASLYTLRLPGKVQAEDQTVQEGKEKTDVVTNEQNNGK